jgi:hypothetical protein
MVVRGLTTRSLPARKGVGPHVDAHHGPMTSNEQSDGVLITLSSDPASDSWGFVGVVRVGDFEAYRTIGVLPSPGEALGAAQHLLADVLGSLMAGQEWRSVQDEFGHAPRRT